MARPPQDKQKQEDATTPWTGGSIVGGSVPSVHSMRAGPGRGFLAKAGVTEGETAQWGLKSQRGFNCYSFQKNTQDFLSG